jgi:uncharacterized oligopeptide transporter (OPT) family protein
VEVQFGKYAFVAFDVFVKHLLFYTGHVINLGIEILPMHAMLHDPAGGRSIEETMVTSQFSFPAALQWKGVSDLVTAVFGGGADKLLTASILWSMGIAGVASLVMEIVRIRSRGRFPLSPLAIGLGVLVPPESTFMMFLGALFFWWMSRRYEERRDTTGWKLWVDTQEPICAGLIAGAALIGISDVLIRVFVFGD